MQTTAMLGISLLPSIPRRQELFSFQHDGIHEGQALNDCTSQEETSDFTVRNPAVDQQNGTGKIITMYMYSIKK